MDDVSEGATSVVERLDGIAQALIAGLDARLTNLAGVGTEWNAFLNAVATDGHGISGIATVALVSAALAGMGFLGIRTLLMRDGRLPAAHPAITELAAAALAVIAVILFARVGLPGSRVRHVAQVWGLAAILSLLVRQLLAGLISDDAEAPRPASRLRVFADTLSFGIAWGLFGLAALSTLTIWRAGPGLRDLAMLRQFTVFQHRKSASSN